MVLTISGVSTPAAEQPRKTSASTIASLSVFASVRWQYRCLVSSRLPAATSARPSRITPLESQTKMFSIFAPRLTIRSRQAMAAAPAPDTTSLTSPIVLPTSSSALSSAADEMIAVPCWSSWKTGIFSRSRSLRSTTKHSGALMSSRLIPPSVGSSAAMISTSLSGSRSASSISNTSMPANFLNKQPLPSITGLAASGPMSPRPSTAVPLVITPTRLPREVYSAARLGSRSMSRQG